MPAGTLVHALLVNGSRVTQLPWLSQTAGEVTAFPGTTAVGGIPGFATLAQLNS